MKAKNFKLIVISLALLGIVFLTLSNAIADNIFLTDDELLTKEEAVQYDKHYFACSDHAEICVDIWYKAAKENFIEGKQQSWSLHAYVAGIAKMYEATLDDKYLSAFYHFVKLIHDNRSDKLERSLGDEVLGTRDNPKIVKAWVAYEKKYGEEAPWAGTEVMAVLDDNLYIVQNDLLHKVNPKHGHWKALPDQNETAWNDTKATAVLGENIYIVQNSRLHKVNNNGRWEVLPDQNDDEAVWSSTKAMAALGENLYIVQNSRLHEVSKNGLWKVLPDQNGTEAIWSDTEVMVALGENLYIVQNSRLHKINNTGRWEVLPDQNDDEAVWSGTEVMVALGENLYIVQNSRLHEVNKNGHWKVLSDQNDDEAVWSGTEAMAALGENLYIVQNSRLHKVYPKDGHWEWKVLPGGRYTAQMHETGMYAELILWFSRIVMENPALHAEYGDATVKFAYGAMEAIHEFNANLEKDYYVTSEKLAPWEPREAGSPVVYNIQHLMLRALIDLTRVIHSDYYQASPYSSVLDGIDYRKLAPKILSEHQAYFKKDWRGCSDDTVIWPRFPDNWWYGSIIRPRFPDYTIISPNWWCDKSKLVTDDVPHASVSIEYILKLYENQGFLNNLLAEDNSNSYIELTLKDINKIANSFLYKIDRRVDNNGKDEEKDIFFNAQMDGTLPYKKNKSDEPYSGWLKNGGITGWIQLSLGDIRVFRECAKSTLWIDGNGNQPFMDDGGDAYFPYILKEKNDRYKNIFISFNGSSEIVTNSPALGTLAPKDVRIGDFDGDGNDDILAKSQSSLYVSWSGKTGWSPFGRFDLDIKYLGTGDFDGNGTTDLFYRDDQNQWRARFHDVDSRDIPAIWKNIGASVKDVPNIRFGDFDGSATIPTKQRTYAFWGLPALAFALHGWQRLVVGRICRYPV